MIIEIKLPDPKFCDGCPYLSRQKNHLGEFCGYSLCSFGLNNYCFATIKALKPSDDTWKEPRTPRPIKCIEENGK